VRTKDWIATRTFDEKRKKHFILVKAVNCQLNQENQLLGLLMNLYRKEAGCFGIPPFFGTSSPCIQNAQTNFSTVVEVRIESNSASSGCYEKNVRWDIRILRGKVNIKFETPVGIRSSRWTRNEHLWREFLKKPLKSQIREIFVQINFWLLLLSSHPDDSCHIGYKWSSQTTTEALLIG